MSSNTTSPAIGALILVPIIIAVSAAFIALKASEYSRALTSLVCKSWHNHRPWSEIEQSNRRHRLKRINSHSSHFYTDSWFDQDSTSSEHEIRFDSFIGQEIKRGPTIERNRAPEPLRIIKRSQTISNCSASGKAFSRGRRFSSSSDQRKKSPPTGPEWPVTVRKKRHGKPPIREILFDNSLNNSESENVHASAGEILDNQAVKSGVVINKYRNTVPLIYPFSSPEDPDMTAKDIKRMARKTSAGTFLKSELHSNSKLDNNWYSIRGNRPSLQYDKTPDNKRVSEPRIPKLGTSERRSSKSGNFFFRALTSRSQVEHNLSPIVGSNYPAAPKCSIMNRISRSRKTSSISSESPKSSRLDAKSYQNSYQKNEVDPVEAYLDEKITPLKEGLASSSLSSAHLITGIQTLDALVLCPEIKITPEIPSVDIDDSTIWVAVEIYGALKKANGTEEARSELDPMQASITSTFRDLGKYGCLENIHVFIEPAKGCLILDMIETHQEPLVLRANDTHLILAKIRFKATFLSDHSRVSSTDDLFTELQNDLGDNWSHYITVRVSYKHSCFRKKEMPCLNTSSVITQATQMQTEATAVIRRHNSKSVWSPRNSQVSDVPLQANPMIHIIEAHFCPREAREAIKKISESQPQIRPARRQLRSDRPVEEIINPTLPTRLKCNQENVPLSPSKKWKPKRYQPFSDEPDPARKIWTEIRHNSRGNHTRKTLNSICFHGTDQKENHLCSGNKSNCSSHALSNSITVDQERDKILEVALRNKRSLGAETLRSIAPSVVEEYHPKPEGEGGSGLDLGIGGNWLVGLFSGL